MESSRMQLQPSKWRWSDGRMTGGRIPGTGTRSPFQNGPLREVVGVFGGRLLMRV